MWYVPLEKFEIEIVQVEWRFTSVCGTLLGDSSDVYDGDFCICGREVDVLWAQIEYEHADSVEGFGDFEHIAGDAEPAAPRVENDGMDGEEVLRNAYGMSLDAVNGASDQRDAWRAFFDDDGVLLAKRVAEVFVVGGGLSVSKHRGEVGELISEPSTE